MKLSARNLKKAEQIEEKMEKGILVNRKERRFMEKINQVLEASEKKS